MNTLTRYDNDGIELVIDNSTGEAFATVRGYARMAQKSHSTIIERLKRTGRENELKSAEIQTAQGLRTGRLMSAKLVFEWLMKDNPTLAAAMGEAGATVYLQRLAGWQPPVTEQKQLTRSQKLAEALVIAAEEIDKLKETVDELVHENATLTPKAEVYDDFIESTTLITWGELAKDLDLPKLGRNNLIKTLRRMGIIQQEDTLPYQRYMNRGYFEVKPVKVDHGGYEMQTFLTPEGVEYILKRLRLAGVIK